MIIFLPVHHCDHCDQIDYRHLMDNAQVKGVAGITVEAKLETFL